MGAGKSTVGKILAGKLNRNFYDTDGLIEETTQKTISEIFESEGEDSFRDREEEAIKKVTKELTDSVIALGGGAVLRKRNLELIKNSGFTVYLEWKLDVLLSRLVGDDSRPLVASTPRDSYQEELLKLFELRKPQYEQADFSIDCSDDLMETQVADEIINRLERNK